MRKNGGTSHSRNVKQLVIVSLHVRKCNVQSCFSTDFTFVSAFILFEKVSGFAEGKCPRIAAGSEKHLFLSIIDKCSFNMSHACADTGMIDFASQFSIVPVGFEATRRGNPPKAAIFLPIDKKVNQCIGCLIQRRG